MLPEKLQSIDCRNEVEMEVFGAKLLQQATLSVGIELLHYHHLPTELPKSASQQHLILINTEVSPKTYVEQVTEGKIQKTEMKLEDVMVIPAQIEASARWNRSHSYLALCLDPIALTQQVGNIIRGYSVELLPQFAVSASLIRSIALSLQQELSNPGFGGQLYLDSLLTTLCTHLLRHYSTQQLVQIGASNLSPSILNLIKEYIEIHLAENLSLTQLANIARIRPNYFATQFKQSMRITPHQYVIQRRIERAKQLIIARQGTISELANTVGFADQSHYTRHFKR
ncbi:MAG: helix-turn-helix transcriptional regulator [Pleurocapsa sp.]